jgi:lipoprotein-releasing system ATP-binding protein
VSDTPSPPSAAHAPPAPLLVARSLSKVYGGRVEEVVVFRDLDFEVRRGEMVAVLGTSGAGKSTLLHLLGGLDRVSGGSVILDEFDITKVADVDLTRLRNRKIGFVFQFHHLLPEFTALENVMMPLLIGGRPVSASRVRARDLLQRVGLRARAAHRPGELSGGERQRVALARALVNSPVLLLADEPTGNLDQRTGAEVFSLIRELHATERLTSVIVTHNEQLAATCDRVLRLAGGQLSRA